MTDTRLIMNGLDKAGDVLAEMAKREGGYSIHPRVLSDGNVEFSVGKTMRKPGETLGTWVNGTSESLPGAFLRFFEAVANKQAEIDKEAADRAAFEAFRAQRQQEAA